MTAGDRSRDTGGRAGVAERGPYRKGSHSGERVAAEIRRAIRYGELLPGEHVRQEVWGDRVGVSGGPTREALKILVAEGLLSYDAHRGYFVARFDPSEIAQYYRLRQLLETEILRSIRWPTAEEIGVIRSLVERTLDCVRSGDVQGAMDGSQLVMFTLLELSPLRVLVREAERCWNMTMTYRVMLISTIDDPEDNNLSRYYAKLLGHLESGDREALVELNDTERNEIPGRLRLA